MALCKKNTDLTVRDIIRGALAAWDSLEHSTFLKAGEESGTVAIHDASGLRIASVRRTTSPIGLVWHVGLGDRRERVFPSVVTALRYLRGHLCPQREAGRVLFGAAERQ